MGRVNPVSTAATIKKLLDIPASRKRLGLAFSGRHFAAQNDRDRPIHLTMRERARRTSLRGKSV
jgi:hypothetical protein